LGRVKQAAFIVIRLDVLIPYVLNFLSQFPVLRFELCDHGHLTFHLSTILLKPVLVAGLLLRFDCAVDFVLLDLLGIASDHFLDVLDLSN
jgi:hypothetical protein